MTVIVSYLRFLARCMWVGVLAWTGCLRWAERRLRDRGAIVTLTFHRVLEDSSYRATNSLPGIVIRECTFRDLVRYVACRCEPVAFADAVLGTSCGTIRVAFTFDDGWHDNYTTAFPIVRAYRVPITIFVCPGALGKTAPFWPEQALALLRATRLDSGPNQLMEVIESLKRFTPERREQYLAELSERAGSRCSPIELSTVDRTLSWDEIVEMDKAGVCFGSHTDTHQILTTIPATVAQKEVRHSKVALERMLGKPCQVFAYPNGDWSPETRHIVEEMGFVRAVTTQRGVWTSVSDPLAIPRSNVCESNVVGITGRFWPAMFEYTMLWKAWRARPYWPRPVSERPGSIKQASKREHETSNVPELSRVH
jgi:peptidoglycan/xylan/chitin deacetylase (PgdA/CDA1 family)